MSSASGADLAITPFCSDSAARTAAMGHRDHNTECVSFVPLSAATGSDRRHSSWSSCNGLRISTHTYLCCRPSWLCAMLPKVPEAASLTALGSKACLSGPRCCSGPPDGWGRNSARTSLDRLEERSHCVTSARKDGLQILSTTSNGTHRAKPASLGTRSVGRLLSLQYRTSALAVSAHVCLSMPSCVVPNVHAVFMPSRCAHWCSPSWKCPATPGCKYEQVR